MKFNKIVTFILFGLVSLVLVGVFFLQGSIFNIGSDDHNSLGEAFKKDPSKKLSIADIGQSSESKDMGYIIDCPEQALQNLEENEFTHEDVIEKFKNSSNHESKLTFEIVKSNPILPVDSYKQGGRISNLLDLAKKPETSSLAYYYLLTECSYSQNADVCEQSIIPRALIDNSDNGAIWLKIAGYEANRNNLEGFSWAMRQTIAAPNYNEYWGESIELFEKAIEDSGVSHFGQRLILAIGFGAAIGLPDLQRIITTCVEFSKLRADIAQVCIETGDRMVNDSDTMITRSIGFALKEKVQAAIGNDLEVIKLQELKKQLTNEYQMNFRASTLMMFDEELSDYWLTQLKLFGELKANQLLIQEAMRLSSNPEYNPCPID